jgi:hypothetical protein
MTERNQTAFPFDVHFSQQATRLSRPILRSTARDSCLLGVRRCVASSAGASSLGPSGRSGERSDGGPRHHLGLMAKFGYGGRFP